MKSFMKIPVNSYLLAYWNNNMKNKVSYARYTFKDLFYSKL